MQMGRTRDDQLKEMEKRVEMLKNVVERVERENIQLQQSPAVVSHQALKRVQAENDQLKVCIRIFLTVKFSIKLKRVFKN